jgi:hypothetical protein
VEPHGFEVIRADEEDRPGMITTHIIERLISDDLVVADLTGWNPNVFYELAVRHVARKPLVQIIRAEEEIPFDVQTMRTVKFELSDPDALEVARAELSRQVSVAIEEEEIETPISQAVGQQLALESGDPEQVEVAELARAVQALTAEVRARSSASTFQPISGRIGGGPSVQIGEFGSSVMASSIGPMQDRLINLGATTPTESIRIIDAEEMAPNATGRVPSDKPQSKRSSSTSPKKKKK